MPIAGFVEKHSYSELLMSRSVGIIGASGWLGEHLTAALLEQGRQVVGFSRRPREDQDFEWRQWDGEGEIDLSGVGGVVNLAGEAIDQRWNQKRKEAFYRSRITLTENLVNAVSASEVKVLLNSSAVGIYGDRKEVLLSEGSKPGAGYLAELCVAWEKAAMVAEDSGIRVCCLRTGVVLGRGGRAWEKIRKVFRLGLGGKLGDGRQWMPWIHLDDEIGGIIHCLDQDLSGPVNLVSPYPVRNEELTLILSRAVARPAIFPVPRLALKLVFGEFAEEGLLASQKVEPAVLKKDRYQFKYSHIGHALADLTT